MCSEIIEDRGPCIIEFDGEDNGLFGMVASAGVRDDDWDVPISMPFEDRTSAPIDRLTLWKFR